MEILIKLVVTFALLLSLISLSAFTTHDTCPCEGACPNTQLSWEIPSNPDFSFVRDPSPFMTIGAFAWKEFIALNWPADDGGKPLKEDSIADDRTLKYQRIWESFDQLRDVFETGTPYPRITEGAMPVPVTDQLINSIVATHDPDYLLDNGELNSDFFLENSDFGDSVPNILPAFSRAPLIDRTGNYIINEIHIGREESEQILKNDWNIAQNQWDFNNSTHPFNLICSNLGEYGSINVPCNDVYGQTGAIELKAAWRIFPLDTPNKEKKNYYHVTRIFTIPPKQSVTGKEMTKVLDLGLVGFHILHKTSENGWIWSTFEQTDNVPNGKINSSGVFTQQGEQPPEFGYTLYDCPQGNCPYNENGISVLKDVEDYLWNEDSPYAWGRFKGDIKPRPLSHTPIKRDWGEDWFVGGGTNVKQNVECLNENWQALFEATESVWRNYKLIGIEWLQSPNLPFETALRTITPVHPVLANVTLEPYIQNTSCIVCHTKAYLANDPKSLDKIHSDFSFLLQEAKIIPGKP